MRVAGLADGRSVGVAAAAIPSGESDLSESTIKLGGVCSVLVLARMRGGRGGTSSLRTLPSTAALMSGRLLRRTASFCGLKEIGELSRLPGGCAPRGTALGVGSRAATMGRPNSSKLRRIGFCCRRSTSGVPALSSSAEPDPEVLRRLRRCNEVCQGRRFLARCSYSLSVFWYTPFVAPNAERMCVNAASTVSAHASEPMSSYARHVHSLSLIHI